MLMEMKFLVDQMLGTLAKWLRLCGFDTYFAKQEVDDDLLRIALNEKRTIITRDKELHYRANKKGIPSLLTLSTKLNDQIKQVFTSYPRLLEKITPLNRCSVCNTLLRDIKKNMVEEKVPERVFQNHDYFWQCPTCNRIYWKGTHYEKIIETINDFKDQMTMDKDEQ